MCYTPQLCLSVSACVSLISFLLTLSLSLCLLSLCVCLCLYIFLCKFSPCLVRHGLLLNLEFIHAPRLAGQWVRRVCPISAAFSWLQCAQLCMRTGDQTQVFRSSGLNGRVPYSSSIFPLHCLLSSGVGV